MNIPTNKIIWLDVETTGFDPRLNGIIQLSAYIEIDGEIKETLDYKIRPFETDVLDPNTMKWQLETNGITEGMIMQGREPLEVHQELTQVMSKYVDRFDKQDKFYFYGYNSPAFDMPFMKNWFQKCGDKYFGAWFWQQDVCIMRKVIDLHREQGMRLDSYKLANVAKHYGLAEFDDPRWHDSLFDIEMTRGINLVLKNDINGY